VIKNRGANLSPSNSQSDALLVRATPRPIRATRVSKWQLDAETRHPPPLVTIKTTRSVFSVSSVSLCLFLSYCIKSEFGTVDARRPPR
jgi:hypothetical protein